MAASQDSPALVPPRKRRSIIVAAAACCFTALALAAFSSVGRWLVVEDPLGKARAIAVLIGRMLVRAMEAAKLYRQCYAPEVWLSHFAEPRQGLEARGLAYEGVEAYSTRVLTHA